MSQKLIHHVAQGNWRESLDGKFAELNSAGYEFRLPLTPKFERVWDLQITDIYASHPQVFVHRVYGDTIQEALGFIERNHNFILAEYF